MTRNEDEMSRLREAFAATAQDWRQEIACPEPDRIWAAVRGELPPDEVRDIVEHVAACASCAEDWRIAMAFEEEARAGQEATVHRFPTASRFRPWMAAAAAALVLTVGGIYVRRMQGPAEPPPYRGEQTGIQSLVPPQAVLPRQAFVLAWAPVPGAESYELLATTATLDPVANPKNLTTTRFQIPASALQDLSSGTQLYWRVTAVFPEGGGRTQSRTFITALE